MSPEFTSALPKVTMVFTAVEGAKPFALRHRSRDVREIHSELLAVVRSCLLQVSGLATNAPSGSLCEQARRLNVKSRV